MENPLLNIKYLNRTEFEQFSPSLQKSINDIIVKEGYLTGEVSNREISTAGANYMGDLFEVDIKGDTAKGPKETHLFVKKNITRNGEHISSSEVHMCEIFFYDELSKVFTELQEKADVPLNERYNVAKCYEANLEAIILENMAVQGFKIPPRMDVYSLKFAELSVIQIAKLHGLSFVLQKERKEYYDAKLKPRKYALKWNDAFKLNANNLINITLASVDSDSKKIINACKDVVLQNYAEYNDFVPHNRTTVYCLCHGDYRNGNILMQKIDGEIKKVIPVDYQALYHGCPVMDFIYLIYTGTDYEFRKSHMHGLKDLYYKSLDEFLKYFKMDVEEIYPKNEFEKAFKERLDFGILLTIMWGPMMFRPEQDATDSGNSELHEMKFKPDERFVKRVLGTLEEFEEYGYFNNFSELNQVEQKKETANRSLCCNIS